ncbi:MAG TPA: MBL fold metallo-hydrolase [Nautiliaceae bacterium]|nr:MBL fold metallo-hydrolase [Nautiliaceae bacterium]
MRVMAVSGFNKVGANMFYVEDEKKKESYIFDMGIDVEMALFHNDKPYSLMSKEEAVKRQIVPDDSLVPKNKVKKIIISHAHYDHVAGTPVLERDYNAFIISTPFTIEVLKKLSNDRKERIKNKMIKVNPNGRFHNVEFVKVNHSIPQACSVVVDTSEGKFIYMQDFKIDNNSVFGKINLKRFKEIGQEGVKVLLMESLYSSSSGYSPSEQVAKVMIQDVIEKEQDNFLILTTYSSHIERIKSMVDTLKKYGKEPIILGRSMEKFVKTAQDMKLLEIDAPVYYNPQDIIKVLKEVDKEKHALIVTGNQGEPGSLLDRLANDHYPFFKIEKEDVVIFSSTVIPSPINMSIRALLEQKLMRKGARVIKDVHVSGHAYKEEMRKMIRILNPEYIIPGHQDVRKRSVLASLAAEEGYIIGKEVLLLNEKEFKRII